MERMVYIDYKEEGNIAYICMNGSRKLNVLDPLLVDGLIQAFHKAWESPKVKVMVLSGGKKAFCAGGDLNYLRSLEPEESLEFMKKIQKLAVLMTQIPKPVIAEVDGHAAGAGFSLALLCDLVISSDRAVYSAPFINVGLIPDMAMLYLLPRLTGLLRAKEFVFTGRKIDAEEAYRIGLVNRVVPPAELEQAVKETALLLAEKSSETLGIIKRMMNQSLDMSFPEWMETEIQVQSTRLTSKEAKERMDGFLQKRNRVQTENRL